MANFRGASHFIMMERGRHHREFRTCPFCEVYIRNEIHFMLFCPFYSDLRNKYMYLPHVSVCNAFVDLFYYLMSSDNVYIVRNIAMYIHYATQIKNDYLYIFNYFFCSDNSVNVVYIHIFTFMYDS